MDATAGAGAVADAGAVAAAPRRVMPRTPYWMEGIGQLPRVSKERCAIEASRDAAVGATTLLALPGGDGDGDGDGLVAIDSDQGL